MRALSIALAFTASACGTGPLGPGFTNDLTRFGGCGDVVFYAVDAADEVMVTFRAEGLVAAAREADEETTTVIDLPSERVELVIEQGSRVSDATCDDVIENRGPDVHRTWVATSGTATVRIRPLDEFTGGRGDLLLENVVFTSSGGDEILVEELEWVDASVGWYPG